MKMTSKQAIKVFRTLYAFLMAATVVNSYLMVWGLSWLVLADHDLPAWTVLPLILTTLAVPVTSGLGAAVAAEVVKDAKKEVEQDAKENK